MYNYFKLVILTGYILSTAYSKLKWKNENEAHGIVLLDSMTFDKIIRRTDLNVVVGWFNKIDIGTGRIRDNMRDSYLEFALDGTRKGDAEDILFAQVIVNGAENLGIATRNEVKTFPSITLYKPNSSQPIHYVDIDMDYYSISKFVEKHTSYYIRGDGVVEQLEPFVANFIKANTQDYDDIIAKATDAADRLQGNFGLDGQYYLKTMTNIKEKGFVYLKDEQTRLLAILEADKVSKTKKSELFKKYNVIVQFIQMMRKYDVNGEL